MTEATLEIGQQTADGVYAGLTADGKQQIFAMPTDLDATRSFNDAAEAVERLNDKNTLGHNDWQIPTQEELHVLHVNKDKGALKDTFKTAFSNSDHADWYWSSSPSGMGGVRFSGGREGWHFKDDDRLSCRPVRLVAAAAAAAPSLG
jgi:hypothetical protein